MKTKKELIKKFNTFGFLSSSESDDDDIESLSVINSLLLYLVGETLVDDEGRGLGAFEGFGFLNET